MATPSNPCPIDTTLSVMCEKWKPGILSLLHDRGVVRFSEFLRLLHLSKGKTITKKVLAQQLRELEKDGLIDRRIYPEVPPKVEYCLTEYGQSTRIVIEEIVKWGHGHLDRAK
ncbi:MAG: winged helix-turn-helix transcriptional regulator [Bacilli bacterium]